MFMALCMMVMISFALTPMAAPLPNAVYIPGSEDIETTPMASLSRLTVIVNGTIVPFEAYIINGATYYKLRDIAYVISGTAKQFDVSWDGALNAITILKGQAYTPVGGELTISDTATTSQTPSDETATIPVVPTTSTIFCDGVVVDINAYLIGGSNYMRLRDISVPVGYMVGWNPTEKIITIDSTIS